VSRRVDQRQDPNILETDRGTSSTKFFQDISIALHTMQYRMVQSRRAAAVLQRDGYLLELAKAGGGSGSGGGGGRDGGVEGA
jgi:hypothetical protein